jgi:putative salt-induced outer membrane protein YdiY
MQHSRLTILGLLLAATTPAAAQDAPADATDSTAPASGYVWTAVCEAGFTLTEGNSSTRAANGSCGSSHALDRLTVAIKAAGNYGVARYGGLGEYPNVRRGEDPRIPRGDFIESVRNWLVELREDYALTSDGRLGVFAIESVAADIFKGYDLRTVLEAGVGYAYIKSDRQTHRAEAGVQYENLQLVTPNGDGEDAEDRLGGVLSLLGTVALAEAADFEYKASYLPNLAEIDPDWRLAAEAALVVSLNSRLALKVSGQVAYDNDPNQIAPRDPFGIEVPDATTVAARKVDSALYNTLVLTIR